MSKAHSFSTPRPSVDTFATIACQQFCEEHQIGDPNGFLNSFQVYADGFTNACNLNRDLCWDFGEDKELTQDFINALDDLGLKIDFQHYKAVLDWAGENPSTPLPVGTRVSFTRFNNEVVEGEITEVMDGHKYVINQDNYSRGMPIVPFEEVSVTSS